MARARSIKPGFFKNEELASLPAVARLLFAGLWTLADREGRLEDRPKRILIEILPYESVKSIEKHLDALAGKGFIQRYEVNGDNFISIVKWHKHQNPHHMEVPSEIPPPPGEENRFNQTPVTRQMRESVYARDGRKCVICQSDKGLSIDHIKHVSKGGTSDMDNLRTLCLRCNAKRGAREDESSTSRDQTVKNGSCPTDSLNPVTDSLNLTPDGGFPAPRENPRSAEHGAADPIQRITDAVHAYTGRPGPTFVESLAKKCYVVDPEATPELIELAVHAVVPDGKKIDRPGFFSSAVPELMADTKDWGFMKQFVTLGPTRENIADAHSYCRDRNVPERIRRFLTVWLAQMQSEAVPA